MNETERDMLEHALAGSVKLLLDIVASSEPEIFGRANRVHSWMKEVVSSLSMDHPWELGMAALLAPIGRVTVPPELLVKDSNGDTLSKDERDVLARVPEASKALLSNIPRMEYVSEIVLFQDKAYDGTGIPEKSPGGEEIPVGARLLKILNTLAEEAADSQPTDKEFDRAFSERHLFDEALLEKVRDLLASNEFDADDEHGINEGNEKVINEGDENVIEEVAENKTEEDDEDATEEIPSISLSVTVTRLMPNDILEQDIIVNEILLLKEGSTLTETALERLLLLAELHEYEDEVAITRSMGSLSFVERQALSKE